MRVGAVVVVVSSVLFVGGVAPAAVVRSAADVPNPRLRGSWVTDLADVVDAAGEARLDEVSGALDRELGVELAVVTVRDVPGTPKEFATALFNHWGLGKRDAHNGLLVLLVVDQRRLEMETGYGLEPLLPDGWLGAMQAEVMVPAFRRGDFGGGLLAGVQRIAGLLRERPAEARAGLPAPVDDLRAPAEDAARPPTAYLVPLGGALGVGIFGGRWLHRRRRRCARCHVQMEALDEAEDDAHLDAGQRYEEQLRSVNYHVLRCARCGDMRTLRSVRWLSSWSRCERCQYRTLSTRQTTLVRPTQHSTGLMRVDLDCGHCGHTRTFERVLAALPPPSSSSSSGSSGSSGGGSRGSSSFGGGRSGGGGAGSSW